VTHLQFTILSCSFLVVYLVLIFWKRPVTSTGRFVQRLSLGNVVSWLLLLPQGSRGDPPPIVIYGFVLWLINCPLLIVLMVALWMDYKERDENRVFLATATVYLAMNAVMMWIVPVVSIGLATIGDR
jgi:hypothetical protein